MTQAATAETELVEPPAVLEVQMTKDPEDADDDAVQVVPSHPDEVMVFARNPHEMAQSQVAIIEVVNKRLKAIRAEIKIAENNLDEAKTLKIKTSGWASQVRRWKKRLNYYTKIKLALEQGYFIIPEMAVDVFAIRTDRTVPSAKASYYSSGTVPDEKTRELPAGEGEYKDPSTFTEEIEINELDSEGKKKKRWVATGKLDIIDFPFKLVRPRLLQDLDKAMKQKLFDELGVVPFRARRNPDPMLIGTISLKESSFHIKKVHFLISWWLPTESL